MQSSKVCVYVVRGGGGGGGGGLISVIDTPSALGY